MGVDTLWSVTCYCQQLLLTVVAGAADVARFPEITGESATDSKNGVRLGLSVCCPTPHNSAVPRVQKINRNTPC